MRNEASQRLDLVLLRSGAHRVTSAGLERLYYSY